MHKVSTAGRQARRVVVLHGTVALDASADEQDTLLQAEAVADALRGLGFEVELSALSLDLAAASAALAALRPDLVFNLVEAVGGSGRLIHLGQAVLDELGIPYTGVPLDAQFLTSNKLVAKRMLELAGLPTPHWCEGKDVHGRDWTGAWIVKSTWEHASVGMDDGAVVPTLAAARSRVRSAGRLGDWFAEAYVEGRELNLALLGGGDDPVVLSAAEIRFDGYPPGKPRIVGYAAKWDAGSFEYLHTPRVFLDPQGEAGLLSRLEELAVECWRLFRLQGYARVDFRVDTDGRPWILEVNANPCLSPDAGFAAAAARVGMPYADLVGRIVADALNRIGPQQPSP